MDKLQTDKSSGLKRFWHVPYVLLLLIVALGSYQIFSAATGNFKEVVPHKVYRSAQPTPEQLREWTKKYGIKTVINLRGDEEKTVKDEQAAADELGLKMITMTLSSRRLPAMYLLLELIENIEAAEPPVLLHCRSGIDRAGTASVLAAMAIDDMDYDKARWQAYVAPGPWKRMKYEHRDYPQDYSHISDLFRLYESYCKQNNLDTNNWQQFKKWVHDTNSLPEAEPE